MNVLVPNPLAEADPRSLQDLFDLDPLVLSRDQSARAAVVAELRAQRERWLQAETKAKARPAKRPATLADLEDLKL